MRWMWTLSSPVCTRPRLRHILPRGVTYVSKQGENKREQQRVRLAGTQVVLVVLCAIARARATGRDTGSSCRPVCSPRRRGANSTPTMPAVLLSAAPAPTAATPRLARLFFVSHVVQAGIRTAQAHALFSAHVPRVNLLSAPSTRHAFDGLSRRAWY